MASDVTSAAQGLKFLRTKDGKTPSPTFRTLATIREARFMEQSLLGSLDKATTQSKDAKNAAIKSMLETLRGQPTPSSVARAIAERRAE